MVRSRIAKGCRAAIKSYTPCPPPRAKTAVVAHADAIHDPASSSSRAKGKRSSRVSAFGPSTTTTHLVKHGHHSGCYPGSLGFPASSLLNPPPMVAAEHDASILDTASEEDRSMVTDGECSTPGAPRKGTAVRSHSEAERKRRQRINAHLATLRTLLPSASRMDKAALLGEVVRHVRELQGRASGATEGVVPGESDEVGVEEDDDPRRWGRVRAWVCCADRPGLLSDLSRAVRSVGNARTVRAEMATVAGRTRSVLELDNVCHEAEIPAATSNDRAVALSTLRAALRAVLLDREELLAAAATAAAEGYKRPRLSPVQQLSWSR